MAKAELLYSGLDSRHAAAFQNDSVKPEPQWKVWHWKPWPTRRRLLITFPPTQYRLYMGDCFYRSKDPTNSIKVLKEKSDNTKNKIHICTHNNRQKGTNIHRGTPLPGRRYKFHIGQQFQVQVCSMSLIIIHQFVRYDRPTFYFQYHIQYCNDSSIYVTLIYYSENKCINV